jgi:hypothetical protein
MRLSVMCDFYLLPVFFVTLFYLEYSLFILWKHSNIYFIVCHGWKPLLPHYQDRLSNSAADSEEITEDTPEDGQLSASWWVSFILFLLAVY